MARAILVAALAAVALVSTAAAGPEPNPPARIQAKLTIVVWPNGVDGRRYAYTLRCAPAGGTLPNRGKACLRLAALRNPFAPVPEDAVCTMQYGGPQVATVTGTYAAKRISTRFTRANGCQITRWNRVAFLFPSSRIEIPPP